MVKSMKEDMVSILERHYIDWYEDCCERDRTEEAFSIYEEHHSHGQFLWNTKCTLRDAHEFIQRNLDDYRFKSSGFLLAHILEKVREKILIFDDKPKYPINWFGYCQDDKHILINNGFVGDHYGMFSYSVVVNNGDAGNNFGQANTGIMINNGTVGDLLGTRSEGIIINNGKSGDRTGFYNNGLVICVNDPKSYVEESSTGRGSIIKPEELKRLPALEDYILNLCAVFSNKEDQNKHIERFFADKQEKDTYAIKSIQEKIYKLAGKHPPIKRP